MSAVSKAAICCSALGLISIGVFCGKTPHPSNMGELTHVAIGGTVRSKTGAPLRGARITVRDRRQALGETFTDSSGAYVIRVDPAADLLVSAAQPGFVSLAFGQAHPFEPAVTVRPSVGDTASTLDFHLEPACSLSGTIADDSNTPYSAVVSLAYATTGRLEDSYTPVLSADTSPGVELRPTETDSRGRYVFNDIPSGDYFISAVIKEHARAGGIFGHHYFPATKNPSEAKPVSCKEPTTANLTVRRDYVASVSGRVSKVTGAPAAGALVRFFSQTSSGTYYPRHSLLSRADATGRFSLPRVHPGSYLAVASIGQAWSAPGQQGEVARGLTTVDLRPGANEDVSIRVLPGMTLTGNIRVEPAGTKGAPANMRIASLCYDRRLPATTTTSAAVSESGEFTIRNVFATETLYVDIPRRSGLYLKSIVSGSVDFAGKVLPFQPGGHITGVSVFLSSRVARLRGSVTSHKRIVADSIVLLFAEDETKWLYPLDRYVIAARTDSHGRFEVTNIVPGRYHATAIKKLPSAGPLTGDVLRRLKVRSVPISFEEEGNVAVNLELPSIQPK